MSTVTPAPTPDFAAITERQRQVWRTGDYHVLGTRIVYMSERLCDAMDLHPGMRVLDVASGSGNTALAAARMFCDVTSTDFVQELLDQGLKRAEAEGLPITFEVADAQNLPYADASFDAVLSTVGAMFAPDQKKVASELLRVCKPGGQIGMGNWTPDSFVGRMGPIAGKYLPPPPGLQPPIRWGTEEGLRELFGDGVTSIETTRKIQTSRFLSMDHFVTTMGTYFGPIKSTLDALDETARQGFIQDLRAVVAELNRSGDDTIIFDMPYLEVIAIRA